MDLRAQPFLTLLRALLEGHRDECLAALEHAAAMPIDAEAQYHVARTFAKLGMADRFQLAMERVVSGGFFCYDTFLADPWLDDVRGLPHVQDLLARAQAGMLGARTAFKQAGGETLLA